jgi:hypothetical protein
MRKAIGIVMVFASCLHSWVNPSWAQAGKLVSQAVP